MPFPATNRLPLRRERDRLTREGRTFHTNHFTIISAPSSLSRFSILVSKKTARLAVDRNRIKRRTSAILARLLSSFPTADYMVIPKRSVLEVSYTNLISDLSKLISELKKV